MLVQHHHHRSTTHSLDHVAALAQRASCCLTCSVALPRLHPPWKRAVYSIVVAGCTTSRNNWHLRANEGCARANWRWWWTGLVCLVTGNGACLACLVCLATGNGGGLVATLNSQQAHELRIRHSCEQHYTDTHRCTWRKHGEVGRSDRARRDISGHWAS
jgi:hypothetical protein